MTLGLSTDVARRVGVIGDVHGRFDLLTRAADALHQQQVDMAVCVGDIYAGAIGFAECCAVLCERRIQTVRGNHDRWFVEAAAQDGDLAETIDEHSRAFLTNLPATRILNTTAGPALLCHGIGTNDLAHVPQAFPYAFVRRSLRLGLIPPDCKLVIHGHSHRQIEQTLDGIMFITVGPLCSDNPYGCITVDMDTRAVTSIGY